GSKTKNQNFVKILSPVFINTYRFSPFRPFAISTKMRRFAPIYRGPHKKAKEKNGVQKRGDYDV
ncbi:MAG: hypothetical protein ACYSN7_02255, partial [Planctomycetota bacterium]